MSRYRMCLLRNFRKRLVSKSPAIWIHGHTEEAAVAMSRRIWDGLAGEEPALGFTLVDTDTGRVCYTGAR